MMIFVHTNLTLPVKVFETFQGTISSLHLVQKQLYLECLLNSRLVPFEIANQTVGIERSVWLSMNVSVTISRN